MNCGFNESDSEFLDEATDLRKPEEIFNTGRQQRKIIFHSGPPNTGKTHQAVQDFIKSTKAIYCCPLRLLAGQIAQKVSSQGIPCDMITGEEKVLARPPSRSSHLACTIQLVDLDSEFDVAIIDEIQMLSNPQSGGSFVRAFFGLKAKTLHVCGDYSAYKIIRTLAAKCGESVALEEHKQPIPLQCLDRYLGGWNQLQTGDCIICFSKAKIRTFAKELRHDGFNPAIVYGALPPETKNDQIDKFNNGERNVLVATDAIGMGLNAQINRVIFCEFNKRTTDENGEKYKRELTALELKQIAGRAARQHGRFANRVGYTMARYKDGVLRLKSLFRREIPSIEKVGIRPPGDLIEIFGKAIQLNEPNIKFEEILDRYMQRVQIDESLYFLCKMNDIRQMAFQLRGITLKIKDKFNFCYAPISPESLTQVEVFVKMVQFYSCGTVVNADWMKSQIRWQSIIQNSNISKISELNEHEDVYGVLSLYNWMNNKFPDLFPDDQRINEMKMLIAKRITSAVDRIDLLTN